MADAPEKACPALIHGSDAALICSPVCIDVSAGCIPVTANGLMIGSANTAQNDNGNGWPPKQPSSKNSRMATKKHLKKHVLR